MGFYIICEGSKTEQAVYRSWLSYKFPHLEEVDSFLNLSNDKYYMISGDGYPNYFNVIENAIEDIKSNNLNTDLVIIVDAEDFTIYEKNEEIINYLNEYDASFTNYKLVIQTPSIEGWGLGNQKFVSSNPNTVELIELLQHYNVRAYDPEDIIPFEEMNKAQTSHYYLRKAAIEKNTSYTKRNPKILCNETYLNNLINRNTNTGHINCMNMFFDAFQ